MADYHDGEGRSSERRSGDYRGRKSYGGPRGDRRDYRRDDRRGGGHHGNDGGRPRRSWDGDDRDRRDRWEDRGDRRDRYRSEGNEDRPRRQFRDDRQGDSRGGRSWDRQQGHRGKWSDRDDRRGGRPGRDNRARTHSNRGGRDRDRDNQLSPQRPGYREERLASRANEPQLPGGIDIKDLDPTVLQELRSLSKDNAEQVAKHLIMTAVLLDSAPEKALAHARAAKNRAGRVAVVRETNGIAAYHAGEWKEAIAELRAARRMSGGLGLLPVLADSERGLGNPAKALNVAAEAEGQELSQELAVELAIVVAGAHTDLKQIDEAVEKLAVIAEVAQDQAVPEVTRLRLSYAYADVLELAGKAEEAREWFIAADELDSHRMTDAADRVEALAAKAETKSELENPATAEFAPATQEDES